MARYITITLTSRAVSCTARLLEEEAPRTAAAVWEALPLASPVFHGKYARNEIYQLVPAFAEAEPGKENTTVTPIPGDLCYFAFDANELQTPSHGYEGSGGPDRPGLVIDLALFYGRNNLLLNGDQGWVPGNVFATVVAGLEGMVVACQDIWMGGARGETLSFSRLDESEPDPAR